MMNTLTDAEMAKGIAALAQAVSMAAANLEDRRYLKERCSCNLGQPGLCGHHAWAYEQLREAAVKLGMVRAYLEKDRNAVSAESGDEQ